MIQLNMFEKLPQHIAQKEWEKDHIKNPPPFSTEDQRKQAQEKLEKAKQLKISKLNLS